jgi:hypothetical protein
MGLSNFSRNSISGEREEKLLDYKLLLLFPAPSVLPDKSTLTEE